MASTVNLKYISKDDLKTFYGFVPDEDQTTTDVNKTDLTVMAIASASERVNSICGQKIEELGINNLNSTQIDLVKRATARMTIYYLTDGMAFLRASVSISGNGMSSSISPPNEPDYVPMEVYNLLQQSNLYTPRKALTERHCKNKRGFLEPSIYDESDTRTVTWDSANKTFLTKDGVIAGTAIRITDVSDTVPKIKIDSIAGTPTGDMQVQADFTGRIFKFDDLDTQEKTLVLAIDENAANIQENYDQISEIYQVVLDNKLEIGKIRNTTLPDLQNQILLKQNKTDPLLETDSKNVVGAINELKNSSGGGDEWEVYGQPTKPDAPFEEWSFKDDQIIIGRTYRLSYNYEARGQDKFRLYLIIKSDEFTNAEILLNYLEWDVGPILRLHEIRIFNGEKLFINYKSETPDNNIMNIINFEILKE